MFSTCGHCRRQPRIAPCPEPYHGVGRPQTLSAPNPANGPTYEPDFVLCAGEQLSGSCVAAWRGFHQRSPARQCPKTTTRASRHGSNHHVRPSRFPGQQRDTSVHLRRGHRPDKGRASPARHREPASRAAPARLHERRAPRTGPSPRVSGHDARRDARHPRPSRVSARSYQRGRIPWRRPSSGRSCSAPPGQQSGQDAGGTTSHCLLARAITEPCRRPVVSCSGVRVLNEGSGPTRG